MEIKGFRAEPVVWTAAVRALLYAATTFGLVSWTDLQTEAVLGLVTLVLIPAVEFVTSLIVRARVASNPTLKAAGTSIREVRHLKDDAHAVLVPKRHGRLVEDWERDR